MSGILFFNFASCEPLMQSGTSLCYWVFLNHKVHCLKIIEPDYFCLSVLTVFPRFFFLVPILFWFISLFGTLCKVFPHIKLTYSLSIFVKLRNCSQLLTNTLVFDRRGWINMRGFQIGTESVGFKTFKHVSSS